MNKQYSPEELKEEIISFLKEHKDGSLATCMNNMPRSSPVQYFLGDDLNIYILSAGGEKFKAIRQNPNVCLLVNTEYINYRKIKGVQIFGKAITSLEDSQLLDEASRYCQEPWLINNEKGRLNAIKIVPEEIVYLNSLEEGDRTKQILKGNQVMVKEDRIPALV
ncbi:pyridoxamine 5'-phosphate oxidase family protein [Pseudoclostridium thermosuccinogenes]|uniref:pyridoxamine 5'-phosphate oxidase family protein n=1 Tax=Clostridium thermosuccinogenes TaxID=84032 RepID=UPI002FDAB550